MLSNSNYYLLLLHLTWMHRKLPSTGASLATSRLLKKGKEGMQAKLGITGLTGPGEPWFHNSVGLGSSASMGEDGPGRLNVRNSYSDVDGAEVPEEDEEDVRKFLPSVFSELREAEDDQQDEDPLEDEFDDNDDASYKARKAKFGWDINNYKDPSELDSSASAAEIVQAWAFRLKGTLVCIEHDLLAVIVFAVIFSSLQLGLWVMLMLVVRRFAGCKI